MISRLSILLIASLYATVVLADDCCRSICDILNCGLSYQTRIGIYPTIWRNRSDVFLNSCDCISNTPGTGTNLGQLPKFNKFYKLPWIVGTQILYSWCDCVSLYGELNYIQAGHKKTALNTLTGVNTAFATRLGDYRAISAYVGVQYNFWDWCGCDNASFFVGAKIGFIHHGTILAHQVTVVTTTPSTQASCICSDSFKRDFLKKSTKISGGANIGLDYCLCERLFLVLTGEVVVSGGPKGNACIPLLNTEIIQLAGGSSLAVNKIKTEISFPVTLGLKYNF